MSEPNRLVDESDSDFERQLLRAGSSYQVSSELRDKTLAALGLAGVATITTSVATATTLSAAPPAMTSTSLLAKFGWVKVFMAVASVGGLAAIPGYLLLKDAEPANQVGKTPAQVVRAPAAPKAAADRALEPAAPHTDGTATEVAPSETPSLKSQRTETKPADGSAALRAELTSLDAARTLLASGNASGALAALDSYDRANPKGRLKLEAEVLRIDALAKSGRADAARKRAEAFLARHPNSVLASRVRRYTER